MPTDKGPAKGARAGTSLQREAGARHVFHLRRLGHKAWQEVTHSRPSIEDAVVLTIPTLLDDPDEECLRVREVEDLWPMGCK